MQAQRYYREIATNKEYLCTAVKSGIAVMTPVNGGKTEAVSIQDGAIRFKLLND